MFREKEERERGAGGSGGGGKEEKEGGRRGEEEEGETGRKTSCLEIHLSSSKLDGDNCPLESNFPHACSLPVLTHYLFLYH